MPKALFINFDQGTLIQLEGVESRSIYTKWDGGSGPIFPEEDDNFVFLNASFGDHNSSSLHAGDEKLFQEYVRNGGVIVAFLSNPQNFHIRNLIGLPEGVNLQHQGGNVKAIYADEGKFQSIFSNFGNKIIDSSSLYSPSATPDGSEDLAMQTDIHQVVAAKFQFGKGFYIFLPNFGNENIGVITLLVNNIFPNNFPELFEQPSESWTYNEEYLLPESLAIKTKISDVKYRYEENIKILDDESKKVWEEKQEPYLRLITSQGDSLKESVAMVFRELGFYVIDVDEFLKEKGEEASLEEDLWLLDSEQTELESIMKQDKLKIVEVKGMKNTPSDEDTTSITKYVRKRIRETKNSQIKGILIVNHLMGVPAFSRRSAFRKPLVDNAKDVGELLISTNNLFKFVKALKNGERTAGEIKELVEQSSGELTFDES